MRVFSLRHAFIQIPILAVIAALVVTASATIYGQIAQEGRPLETVGTINLIATPACTGTTPVVNLSWNQLPQESSYVVFRTPQGAYQPQSLGTPSTNQFIDSQVTAGTSYIYTVEGQTTSVRSGFVAATALTVCGQTGQPPQPTPTPTPAPGVQPTPTPTPPVAGQTLSLSALPGCAGTTPNVGLFWNQIAAADNYIVMRDGLTLANTPSSVYTDRAVSTGSSHTYQIITTAGVQSNSATATVPNCQPAGGPVTPAQPTPTPTPIPAAAGVVPGAFYLLTPASGATNVSANPSFDWIDVPGATSYWVYVGQPTGWLWGKQVTLSAAAWDNGAGWQTCEGCAAQSVPTTLATGRWLWMVTAQNTAGQSWTQPAYFEVGQPAGGVIPPQPTPTPTPAPGVQPTPTPTPPVAGQTLSLSTLPGCNGTTPNVGLFWSQITANNYLILRDGQALANTTSTYITVYTDRTVVGGSTHTYQVVANSGIRSNSATATVPNCQPAGAVTPSQPPSAFSLTSPANQATGVSNNPDFDWTDAAGAQGYWVYVGQPGAGWLWSKTTSQSQASWNNGSGWQKMEGKNQEPPSSFPDVAAAGDAASWNWFVTAFNSAGQTHATHPPDLQLGGSQVFVFTVGQLLPGAFFPTSPADNAIVSANPCFDWTDASGAASYRIRVARAAPVEITVRYAWSKQTTQSQACWDGGSGWVKANELIENPPSSLPNGLWGWTVTAFNAAGQSGGFGQPISGQFVIGTDQQSQPPAGTTQPPVGQPPSSATPPLTGNETVNVAGFVGEIASGFPLAKVRIEVFNGFDDPTYAQSGQDGYYQVTGFRLHPNNNVNPIRVSALTGNPQPGGTAGGCFGPAQEFPVFHQSSRWIPVAPGGSYTVDHWFDCGATRTGGKVGNIEGSVTTADGRPLVEVLVLASPYIPQGSPPSSGRNGLPAYTDANGHYLLQAVGEGQTYVQTSGASSTLGCGFDRGVTVTVVDGQTATAPTITLEDCQATQPKKIGEGAGGGILETIGQAVKNLFGGGGGQTQSTGTAPSIPSTPQGPTTGLVGQTYTFSAQASDPSGDKIAMRFAFVQENGQNLTSQNSAVSDSGCAQSCTLSVDHAFPNPSRYLVYTVAINEKGGQWSAAWSSPSIISIGFEDIPADTQAKSGDTQAPVIINAAIDPKDGDTVSGVKWAWVQASDNVKVDHVALYVDEDRSANNWHDVDSQPTGESFYTLRFTTAQFADGPHTLYFYAFDEAGNASEPATVNVNVLNKPPISFDNSVYDIKNYIKQIDEKVLITVPNFGQAPLGQFLWGLGGCESDWNTNAKGKEGPYTFYGLYQYLEDTWSRSNKDRGFSSPPNIYDAYAQTDNSSWIIQNGWASIASQWPGCTNGQGREWTGFKNSY